MPDNLKFFLHRDASVACRRSQGAILDPRIRDKSHERRPPTRMSRASTTLAAVGHSQSLNAKKSGTKTRFTWLKNSVLLKPKHFAADSRFRNYCADGSVGKSFVSSSICASIISLACRQYSSVQPSILPSCLHSSYALLRIRRSSVSCSIVRSAYGGFAWAMGSYADHGPGSAPSYVHIVPQITCEALPTL